MEDIGKTGVEKYHRSDYVFPSYLRMVLQILHNACRFIFYIIAEIISQILRFFVNMFSVSDKDNSCPFTGRVALITGAGNGFGRSLGIKLAAKGCHVAVVDIDGDAAEATAAKLRSMNVKSVAYKVDVSDSEQVEKLHGEVIKDLGVVDILVNNAAILPLMSFREGTPTDIERIVKTTRVFLGDMIKQKRGHIVGVCSGFGLYPGGRCVTYSSSKFGVRGFMASLTEELIYNNQNDFIKTTTLFPSFMATRKEVSDLYVKLKIAEKFMCISPNFAASQAIQAIKNGTEFMSLPKGMYLLSVIAQLLPSSFRNKIVLRIMGGDIPQIHPEHC